MDEFREMFRTFGAAVVTGMAHKGPIGRDQIKELVETTVELTLEMQQAEHEQIQKMTGVKV